jgi:hypothetical protein
MEEHPSSVEYRKRMRQRETDDFVCTLISTAIRGGRRIIGRNNNAETIANHNFSRHGYPPRVEINFLLEVESN